MTESSETETSAYTPTSSGGGYTEFGEGDLGRLQGILFGDHAQRTHERIDTLEQALLGAMADLQSDLSAQIGKLEKRIIAEEANRATAVTNVADRVTADAKSNKAQLQELQEGLDTGTDKLDKAISEAVTDQRLELEATRRDLTAQIETTEAQLTENSVARSQLAAALVNVAEELQR